MADHQPIQVPPYFEIVSEIVWFLLVYYRQSFYAVGQQRSELYLLIRYEWA